MEKIKDKIRILTSILIYGGVLSYLFVLYGISPLTITSFMVFLFLVVVGRLLW